MRRGQSDAVGSGTVGSDPTLWGRILARDRREDTQAARSNATTARERIVKKTTPGKTRKTNPDNDADRPAEQTANDSPATDLVNEPGSTALTALTTRPTHRQRTWSTNLAVPPRLP